MACPIPSSMMFSSIPGLGEQNDFKFYSLVDLLRHRALIQPEKRAYTFLSDGETGEVYLNYGELDRRARSIATLLQSLSLTSGRALLLYPPGLEYIVGFFGCLYSGVIAVPVYPPRLNSTLPRLQAIIADAQPVAALTTAKTLSTVKNLFTQAPQLGALQWVVTDNILDNIEDDWRIPAIGGDSLAFLQYTSGSTGTPRGVMVSQANVLHNSALIYQVCEHNNNSHFVSWLPAYHDMGLIAGIFQPLYGGFPGTLISPATFLRRPLRWLEVISKYKATTSGGPNFAYDLCVRKIRPEERMKLDLSSWDVSFNGSEPIRLETINRFAAAFEPCGFRREAFYPCYGLAEATLIVSGGAKKAAPIVTSIQATALENNQVIEASVGAADIRTLVGSGHVLQDGKIVIVDPESLVPCPDDRVGEIWVSSPSVVLGYWNQPQETEQTFQARLLDTNDGPFLRTGDLGFLRDGELFVTGRLKDIIIIRGRNHYPQDIELTVERSHPALRAGCGAAFSIEGDHEELLVVVQEIDCRQRPEIDKVIEAIRQAVTEHHQAQVYSVVLIKPGSISKTTSGKIQRYICRQRFLDKTLDEIARDTLDRASVKQSKQSFIHMALLAVAPSLRQTLLESYLLEQVADVLKIPKSRIRPHQSLAALSLDSLMALELRGQIEAELGVSVSATEFLQEKSIEQLASQLLDALQAPAIVPPLAAAPIQQTISEHPLSHIQEAMYFLYMLAPESGAYNIAFAAQICSEVDAKALRIAFQQLTDRHASLRTTFVSRDGQSFQRVHARLEVCFEEIDLPACDREDLKICLGERAYRPFDLQREAPFRACLFRVSMEKSFLLLAAHHIAIDGWSLWVLLDELRLLYAAEKEGAPVSLPELAFKYTDFIHWQTNMLASREGERLCAYWQKELAGAAPELNLRSSRPRPMAYSSQGSSFVFKLNKNLTRQLKALARTEEVTLYMVLLAAFQSLLYRYTGQEDILVSSPTTGRSQAEFKEVIGCFFNVVALRADLSGDPTFKSFLKQIRRTVLGALEHQDYPSHLQAERLRSSRGLHHLPLSEVTFTLHRPHRLQEAFSIMVSDEQTEVDFGRLVLKFFPLERRYARSDLELELIEANGCISAWAQYNTNLFDADSIARLCGHYETLLESITANPDRRISELSILTAAERRQLLDGSTNMQEYRSHHSFVHQFFEEQAQKNRDKVAVVDGDHSFTFHNLNEQADQLADLIKSRCE